MLGYGSERMAMLFEDSLQIAWDYLDRLGEIEEPAIAARYLSETIERRLRSGEDHRILLSNHAINDYRRFVQERRRHGDRL
ncbi:hypothetical protein V1291_005232 [Nitrobacteraceae bacterium AZCC 1564]